MRILDLREITQPIASPIRNADIDFSKMTASLVAVVTDVVRDGRRVVGYGFNSSGRYGQGGQIRERFAPRLLEADPDSLLDTTFDNLDPDRICSASCGSSWRSRRSATPGAIAFPVGRYGLASVVRLAQLTA